MSGEARLILNLRTGVHHNGPWEGLDETPEEAATTMADAITGHEWLRFENENGVWFVVRSSAVSEFRIEVR